MAVRPVVARAVILIITGVSDPLLVPVSSDLLVVMDSIPKISRMDPDTFILVRAKVLIF